MLKQEYEDLKKRIAQESAGASLEQIITEVTDLDPDTLPAKIKEIDTLISEQDVRRKELAEETGARKQRLADMEKERPATEAAEEAESALARVREGVRQYLPVRLAQALLQRAIETYRERHQGPLVKRASELFAELTVGSFEKLATDFLDDDKPILVGVRAGGEKVSVEQMSDGTRDQLYLALRLASLEMHLTGNEPHPLVVDDILINFDDDRARAGLQVLSRLSAGTQVILFTHHSRIADLAQKSVPKTDLFVTRLGG